jgi:carboxyl-terminal processing protease
MLVIACVAYLPPYCVEAENSTRSRAAPESLSEKDRSEVFEKVWRAVNDKYYDAAFNGVDWNAMRERYQPLISGVRTDQEFYALLNRMLGELRDAHTHFRTPSSIAASKTQTATSTGISLREVEGLLAVFRVEPASDATHAGVQSGMIVRRIDNQPVTERLAVARQEVNASSYAPEGLTRLRVYARLLAGPPDTSLKLGLQRADNSLFEVTLTRRIVTTTAAKPILKLLPSGNAYLKFDSFRDGIAKEVKAILEKFKDAPALIIDLRSNGGGEIPEMRKIAGYFFNERIFLGRGISRTGKPISLLGGLVKIPLEAYVGEPGGQVYAKPVAILTSERTGSAAESFTAGLQENNRATVVGSQSCGCVNIFTDTIKVKGGGELQLSELGYASPKDHKLEGGGVTPDEVVALTLADLRAGRDAWIEAAEGLLKKASKQ